MSTFTLGEMDLSDQLPPTPPHLVPMGIPVDDDLDTLAPPLEEIQGDTPPVVYTEGVQAD